MAALPANPSRTQAEVDGGAGHEGVHVLNLGRDVQLGGGHVLVEQVGVLVGEGGKWELKME